jgi:molybdate transport system substrate-binding protein
MTTPVPIQKNSRVYNFREKKTRPVCSPRWIIVFYNSQNELNFTQGGKEFCESKSLPPSLICSGLAGALTRCEARKGSHGQAVAERFRFISRSLAFALCLIFIAFSTACQNSSNEIRKQSVTLTVSAASDLTFAFQEIGKLFEQETGVKVIFNFGATGQLAQQIEQGAPVDVFAAANIKYVEELEKQGLIIPDTKTIYAQGHITLWTRDDSPLRIEGIADLARAAIQRVAIANPDHAPYGVAAREALQATGLWEKIQPKLVLGENVRQTLQYAETGNVDVAIIALSLSVQTQGRWVLVPQELHQSIDQALAVIKSTKLEKEARAFTAFVLSEKGGPIRRRHGFVPPTPTAE